MSRNTLTFVNHACFQVQNDSALLLVDPWLEGPVFNNGWSLIDQSTSNAAMVEQLNRAGVPIYIWFSHEHPDHFSISFIKKFKEAFHGVATFLYRHTLDKRVVDFLRRNGLEVKECEEGKPVALGNDMRLTVFPYSEGDSWCVIESGGRTILNLNDCVVNSAARCQAVKAKLDTVSPRVDLMLTQFGYASWVGNPDELAKHQAAAADKIERIALQIDHLQPALVVPFASFVYFSHPENAYLNEGQNSPRAIADAPRLARHTSLIRFLQPGSVVDLDNDTPASLANEHERALAHWMALKEKGHALLPTPPVAALDEVEAAFMKYRETLGTSLHGLPRLLEMTRRIMPLVIHLSDLQQTVKCSYREGMTRLDRNAPWHVSMSSGNAIFLFKNEYGFDTTMVNGRFRIGQPGAASSFSRFFLPQRMAKNGYYKRHPLATLRYLVASVLARMGRQATG
ncbi:MBL fold metallo-hydrolase [Telluria sp. B2]